jgi:hypothetical protein
MSLFPHSCCIVHVDGLKEKNKNMLVVLKKNGNFDLIIKVQN